jgi:cellobiose phosphorylase
MFMTKKSTAKIGKRELKSPALMLREGWLSGKNTTTIISNDMLKDLAAAAGTISDTVDADGVIVDGEYTITNINTPRTWLYALTNGCTPKAVSYLTAWDSTARGFSAVNSMAGGELTKRKPENYKPLNPDTHEKRSFFIKEDNSKSWSLFPENVNSSKHYSALKCRMTPREYSLEASREEIKSSLKVLCPDGSACEIWELTLTNISGKKRALDLFVQINWNTPLHTETIHPSESIYHPEYKKGACFTFPISRAKQPLTAWLTSEHSPESHEISYENFIGCDYSGSMPSSVIVGQLSSPNHLSPGERPCAVFQLKVNLPSKGEWSTRIGLGAVKGDTEIAIKEAEKIKKNFLSAKSFVSIQKQKASTWNALSYKLLAKSPSAEFNRFFNVWTKHQLITTSLFGNGARTMEFRERMQLIEALVPLAPEKAKELILESMRFQMRDGRVINRLPLHLELPITEEAALDNTLWMCNAVIRYVNETGDFSFLDVNVPFYDHRLGTFETIRNGKVYDHLIAGMHCLFDFRGKFGFCKIGGHDMNRALTKTTKQGGVSAALTMAIMRTAKLLIPVARLRGQKRDIGYLNSIGVNMQSNLDNYGWNGTHYTYAYDDESKSIGGTDDVVGKTHLAAQTWALLSGTAEAFGKTDAVLKALESLNTPIGYKSLSPAYPLGFDAKGGIRALPPGLFENGGIELYGQGLTAFMFADRGMGTKAWDTIKKYLPENSIPEVSTSLPIQLSEFKIGPENSFFGKDLYDNFNSGIAIFRLAMERMIGVYPCSEGLLLNPALPAEWSDCEIQKEWRGVKLSIKFHNPSGKDGVVKKATANGKELVKGSDNLYLIAFDAFKQFANTGKPVCIDALID